MKGPTFPLVVESSEPSCLKEWNMSLRATFWRDDSLYRSWLYHAARSRNEMRSTVRISAMPHSFGEWRICFFCNIVLPCALQIILSQNCAMPTVGYCLKRRRYEENPLSWRIKRLSKPKLLLALTAKQTRPSSLKIKKTWMTFGNYLSLLNLLFHLGI